MKPIALITPVLTGLCMLLVSSCTSPRLERELKDIPLGPSFQPDNVYAEPLSPDIRRVLVFPFHTQPDNQAEAATLEKAMLPSLLSTGRFEVVTLERGEVMELAGRPTFASMDMIPPAVAARLREQWRADAVLLTDITSYRPYKPFMLGVRSRLVSLRDQEVIWACDEVYDAGNEAVEVGARRYAERYLEQEYPLQRSYSVLISPRRFAAYVAHSLYSTLPEREPQEP
ncbi:hypothetical protein H5P28_12090 [Ruficoccus amylovorans]|uniref:Uncharacterized protein n=1 Tax=Ruficoccus amylovorans TaxID=1804625 RepID=A0A842HG38_9BACT|nr:hypothetical protein [Ruficoccus amylovorans]MBC2594998.1 hypothetical protein [Ruficoccus amylovorans]